MTTYAEFTAAVARHAELPEPLVAAVLKSARAQMASILAAGGVVQIPDIGRFQRREKAARTMHSHFTGKSIDVPAGVKIRFKAAKVLLDRVGGARDE